MNIDGLRAIRRCKRLCVVEKNEVLRGSDEADGLGLYRVSR